VIPVYGTILPRPVADISGGGGCSMSDLMDKIGAADADPTVAHILLDVDSPGGSVSLVPEAAAVIRDARTPISAIANTMCDVGCLLSRDAGGRACCDALGLRRQHRRVCAARG